MISSRRASERYPQEERCFSCLMAAQEAMAKAELDPVENLRRFLKRADLPEP